MVSNLPNSERAELLDFLLHTLEASNEGAAAEWLALAEQRLEEM